MDKIVFDLTIKDEYLHQITAGTKTVECRLLDKKRRDIYDAFMSQFPAHLIFNRTVEKRVKSVVIFDNFEQAINMFGNEMLPEIQSHEDKLEIYNTLYSQTARNEYRVICFLM